MLVIGAAGLIGSHLRAAFGDRAVVATYHSAPVAGGVPLDVTDAQAVRALIADRRPGAVVLAAAEAHAERCEREPEATRAVNVDAAGTVIEVADRVGALMVAFSSEYVFDGRAGPYAEVDPIAPINEYGRQKVALESLARAVPRHLVCRTSGVFGWEPARKNFVCQLLARLRSGEPFDVPSDQVITPTYAPELARAVADLIDRGATGTCQVVGPTVLARDAFARLVAERFGLDPALIRPRPSAELGLAAPRPRSAGLRDDRLRQTLGSGLLAPAQALADMRRREPVATA